MRPPVLPAPLYSWLHNICIHGNLVPHEWDPKTMQLKDVHITAMDLQVTLAQLMRLIEWYFQEYPRGPPIDPLYDRLPEPIVGRFGEALPDATHFLGRTSELGQFRGLLQHEQPALLEQVSQIKGAAWQRYLANVAVSA
jgi:hypothetical protein